MTTFTPEEVHAAYRGIRERVCTLLRDLPAEAAEWPVPACPEWNVRALVAHMVGTPEDVLGGTMDGAPGAAWTNRQVERHQGQSLAALADALEATAPGFDTVLANFPAPLNSQIVLDVFTHEQDLREAVNRPGATDVDAVEVAIAFVMRGLTKSQPDLAESVLNAGLDRFTLQRALAGRVSLGQLAASGIDTAALAAYFANGPLQPPA